MKMILLTTILALLMASCNFEFLEIKPLVVSTPYVTTTLDATNIVVTPAAVVVVTPVGKVTTICTVLTGVPEGNLNLRTGAGIENPVVTTIQEGSVLEFDGVTTKGWLLVKYGDFEGWVNGIYVACG